MFPCPRSRLRIWPRETGSTVLSRVSQFISILRLNLVLTCGIPPDFRGGVHLYIYCIPPYAIGSVPSFSGHAIAYRWLCGIPPDFRGGVHLYIYCIPPYAIGSVPSLSGHAIAYRWLLLPRVRRHRASEPQGSSERVLPWQATMDQLIFFPH